MTTPDKDTPLIFVVEDEADIARLIASTLGEYGFRTETFGTGRALLSRARRAQPELAILDLGLPDMDGLQVLRELQEQHPCAALILTGRDGLTDRVLGLELGADDYLVKPFEPRELVARVRSILRRYQKAATSEATGHTGARFAGWHFDIGRLNLSTEDGREVSLSAAEAALLQTLLKRPNKILTREQLIGERDLDPFDRSIDVRISRLRRKLEDDPQDPKIIKTVYGAGYLLCASVEWECSRRDLLEAPRAAGGTDRGREGLTPSPPSEPHVRFSRIRLSSRWFPHRDWLADCQALVMVKSPAAAKNLLGPRRWSL